MIPSDKEELRKKYAAINAAKEQKRAKDKELKFWLNHVPAEDQSHYRDIDGLPLDNEKYCCIRGKDCWYRWDTKKNRWRRDPL